MSKNITFFEFRTGLKVEIGAEIRILAGREMDPDHSQVTITGLPEIFKFMLDLVSLKTRHFYPFFSTSFDSSVG